MNAFVGRTHRWRSAATLAVLSLAIVILGVSYAGTGYSWQINDGSDWPESFTEVHTVGDFEALGNWELSDGPIKNEIRVANLGGVGYGSIYVRLQLKEYMEIGDTSSTYTDRRYIIDTDGNFLVYPTRNDALSAWPGHNVSELTDAVTGASGWFVESQYKDPGGSYGKYVPTSFDNDMTNAVRVLGENSPPNAAQDAIDKHNVAPNGECDYLSHDWKTPNAIEEYVLWHLGENVYSLSEWLATPSLWGGGAFWVYDNIYSTGWVYWMRTLDPGQTSENLLEAVQLIRETDGPHYYCIHTDMQVVSYSDLYRWTDMPEKIATVYGVVLPAPTVIVKTSFEGTYGPFTPNFGDSDIYADPTAPDGAYSLRFTFDAGFPSGYAPDNVWVTMDDPVKDMWVSFNVKVSANWEWHQVVQKLAYFSCGDPDLEYTNHYIGIHGYVPTGGTNWDTRAVGFALQYKNYPEPELFWGGNPSILTKNVWHRVELHAKVNTAGVHNGIGQIWLDGQLLIDANNLMWMDAGDTGGFYNFLLTPIFGGYGDPVAEKMYIYYDDFTMQDGPFR